jgi:hypothetical protein
MTKTSVVNVKVKYIRPEFDNLKEWCNNANNYYIGRRCVVILNSRRYPEKSSIWANPFKINKTTNRKQVIQKYDKYIRKKIKDEHLQDKLEELRGKNLGCWCHPEKCHGDVLLKLLKKIDK